MSDTALDVVLLIMLATIAGWMAVDTQRACWWLALRRNRTPRRLLPGLSVIAALTFLVAVLALLDLFANR